MVRGEDSGAHDEVLHLAAGAADVVLGGIRGLARRLPGLGDVRQELRARGELALRRNAPAQPAHMEVLARRVSERAAEPAPAAQTARNGRPAQLVRDDG
ncbi:polyprenyl synthetase [Actinomadura decatromicini]|uniref:Polyprenyl synthetase n=1 Tax=Actinomadura decatromicini TaxID=2604572 RepID=A0A5D3FWD8_9ACTN|nr:polyprenyl synthetase [Actinomadura decatromicini]TYK53167.1 polyprenyl synthetase [Actinomadura decatromicini]